MKRRGWVGFIRDLEESKKEMVVVREGREGRVDTIGHLPSEPLTEPGIKPPPVALRRSGRKRSTCATHYSSRFSEE